MFVLFSHTNQNTKAVLDGVRHGLQATAADVLHVDPHLELEPFQLGLDLQAKVSAGAVVADHDVLGEVGGHDELFDGALQEGGVVWGG